MESEVGIFYLELDSNINNLTSFSDISDSSSSDQYEVLYEIKRLINNKEKLLIKFETEYLYLHLKYIIERHPIYSEILEPVLKNVVLEYEMKFYLCDDIITVEIIHEEVIEYYFKNILSLSSFYKFCELVKDIVIFMKTD